VSCFNAFFGSHTVLLHLHLTCLQVDRINPIAAADLAGCLADWDMLDEDHQQLMKAQLRRLAGTKGLSSDTREVVEDALEEGSSDDSSD
jgi:hypothetical protein